MQTCVTCPCHLPGLTWHVAAAFLLYAQLQTKSITRVNDAHHNPLMLQFAAEITCKL